MALKLGKCRLCLKLGDFYSIFTVDNGMQLAEMVMECSRIKVYDGDGLPDKICSECIQKLSGAYIFKQQCERSDQELRRNYIAPPGFSISPPPPTRQSSDSAFSNHTDISKPSSSNEGKVTPAPRSRKRSIESIDNASVGSRSQDYRSSSSKRVEELRRSHKKPRTQSGDISSDYDDNSTSNFMGETDSDEPLQSSEHKCMKCSKSFKSLKSLAIHSRIHSASRQENQPKAEMVDVPNRSLQDASDSEGKHSCGNCGKTFKLAFMMNRHKEVCQRKEPSKPILRELLVSLEPIDKMQNKKLDCPMCSTKFKTVDNLEKHMRVVHAAVLKQCHLQSTTENGVVSVPCIYCKENFDDYYLLCAHLSACSKRDDSIPYKCPTCNKVLSRKAAYISHLKNVHFEPHCRADEDLDYYECRMCNIKLATQETLITHLAGHMSNIERRAEADDDSRGSTQDDNEPITPGYSKYVSKGPLKCNLCSKKFTYKKSLTTHIEKFHANGEEVAVKQELLDKASTSEHLSETYRQSESESSQEEEDDNTCDICEKQFSYKRLLIHHKQTKHNMSSGTKRAKINLKDCSVKCLICDEEMKVSAINEHNQKHISVNMRPRNVYTCAECGDKSKSCSGLANHIKMVHRLKMQMPKLQGELADFCEVVVTKAEPVDPEHWGQSRNDFLEVPLTDSKALVDLSGFTCPICSKKMPTLISLKRHVNWHSSVGDNIQKMIECFVCKEKFRFQCHYKIHMRLHYKDTNLDPKFLTCTICDRRSKHLRAAMAHMTYHKQTRFKNKDYQCSICKRVFQHRKVYLSHMAIHYKRGESVQNIIVGTSLPNTADKTIFDGTHTCHLCGKVCDSDTSLKHHVTWHKSKTSLYGARHECYICHLMFTNKRSLELHTRTHFEDDNGPYKCTTCGKGFTDEDYFRRHTKAHNFDHVSHKKRIENLRKDKVKCPICTRFYPDLPKLIRHLRRMHPDSKMIKADPDAPPPLYYSCKLCAKVFHDRRRLQNHEEAHLRKPEFFKCKFCGKNTISLKNHNMHIKSHLTQKYLDNPLKCYKCEMTFVKGYDLHHHLRDVHNITETWMAERKELTLEGPLKELQCSICFKVLASKGNYERHIDYHNSLRCNYCFDYFSSLRFLEGHLAFSCQKKKLIGETEVHPRKVKCHYCYKAFHLQVKLDCHLRTQHDVKVSKEASENQQETVCDYCFKVFENEYALNNHKIYHRTIGYFGCIYCNRKFNTLTLFRKHKNHHFAQLNVDNPNKCEHCDETFVAFREMIYHMRDVHNDDKEWVVMPKESTEETCPICNKIFFNLHKHLTYHEENKCKKCNEYFYSRLDFDNHLCAIDSDDEILETTANDTFKYSECSFCFKPITKKDSKLKHDKIHRGSGSISCRFCPLKFKTIDAFNIHAFSHRSRKYNKKPIKCRKCGEKFVKYGPFMKHMKLVHKSMKKIHYRTTVLPERCVVCSDKFPNLHNHYRAHLLNQCQLCHKYFTSSKVFSKHECNKEDSDPSKVFTSDANLSALIKSYVPKDEKDDEKFYGHTDDEDDVDETYTETQSEATQDERKVHSFAQSPIISDVLSLYQKKEIDSQNGSQADDASQNGDKVSQIGDDDVICNDGACSVVNLSDDDSMDVHEMPVPIVVVIDDDN